MSLTTQPQRVRLVLNLFDKWIIIDRHHWQAWSGSKWVPVGGNVQICNFTTRYDARIYAQKAGFEIEGDS